jgi:CRISPR-associated endonuclease/helicase Cas3
MVISHILPVDENNNEWRLQSNEDHSEGVANLAEQFATEFGFGEWGRVLGLLHDKGKEQKDFQTYIQVVSKYKPELQSNVHPQHAYVGALIAKKLFPKIYPLLSYEILGHHAGLCDFDAFEDKMKELIPQDVLVERLNANLSLPSSIHFEGSDIHHFIRMLYSCLVDADFLDTERFMNEGHAELRRNETSLKSLLPRLSNSLSNFKADTPVNVIRAEVQDACKKTAIEKPGFFSLTVPTGGGKTISSLVWAINHAIKFNKKRIIIAIPYTSIIVQTAQTLRDIFGADNVLEHHSNVEIDKIADIRRALKMKLASENWDYPIIVTTNVQLFESMFSNKPSSCRKLHNICNSVIILDEAQTLPLEYLQPIIDGLKTYQRLFGTSILFTTASLPAFRGKEKKGNNGNVLKCIENIKEIIPDGLDLHDKLRRVNLIFDAQSSDFDEVADRMSKYNRVLCIVNTRNNAKEIYDRLPNEGLTLHLSRMMCPNHIMEVINKLKKALKSPDCPIIRVVSTQLIEAGVDIDFPVVLRQESGLDSILQAAGRCNREGKLAMGKAFVFSIKNQSPKGYLSSAINAKKSLPQNSDWFNPDTMTSYFEQLYWRTMTFDKCDVASRLNKPIDFCFASVAQDFSLIDDNCINVVVNYGQSNELIDELENEGPNYQLMRKLGQYSVGIHKNDFDKLFNYGFIEDKKGVYYISDKKIYNDKVGLIFDNHWLEEILIK